MNATKESFINAVTILRGWGFGTVYIKDGGGRGSAKVTSPLVDLNFYDILWEFEKKIT